MSFDYSKIGMIFIEGIACDDCKKPDKNDLYNEEKNIVRGKELKCTGCWLKRNT